MKIERVFVVGSDGISETSLSNWRNLAVGTSERDWSDYEFFTNEEDANAAYERRKAMVRINTALPYLSTGDLCEIAATVDARVAAILEARAAAKKEARAAAEKESSPERVAGKKPLEAVETPHCYMAFRDLVNRWRSNAARMDAWLETADAWGRAADDLCELLNVLILGSANPNTLPRDICQRSSNYRMTK